MKRTILLPLVALLCATAHAQYPASSNAGHLGGNEMNGKASINWAAGGGTAQAQTATFSPAPVSLVDGLPFCWKPAAANTAAAPTFSPNGLTAHPIVKTGGAALAANDLTTTAHACVIYNLANTDWELQNPQTVSGGTTSYTISSLSISSSPVTVTHNLGTTTPIVMLFDHATGSAVVATIIATGSNTLTITGTGSETVDGIVSTGGVGATGATGPQGSAGSNGTNGTNGTNGAAGAGYLATSASSLTTGTGSKSFTTQTGLAYTAGARIRTTSAGTGEFMEGVVTSYSSTSLVATMDHSFGTGTHTDWNINLAGDPGATGSAGATGPAGATGATGPAAGAGMTTTALVTAASSTTVGTPAATATMDASGNISTPGGISSGVGSGLAGFDGLSQGTAPTFGSGAGQVPTTGFNGWSGSASGVTSSYLAQLPVVVPTANQFLIFPAPTSGLSQGVWASVMAAANGGTGVANTATLTLGSSAQNWATLGTGVVKNTTITGALTLATSADIIALWTSCTSGWLNYLGTCTTPGGGGTVTSSGTPTIHQIPIWTTATDAKGITCGVGTVLTGSTTDPVCTATPTLGVSGSSIGGLSFLNTTSGSVSIVPPTGALSSSVFVLPISGDYSVDSAGHGTVSKVNGKTLTLPYGCAVGDPAGSALATGVLCYIVVPMAGTITGWDIVVDAGTATVDVWKIATGTAKPTVTNTITASALPAIATGTAIDSTTASIPLTGWTTAVATKDILGFNLGTVATAKYITVNVQIAH